MLWSGFQLHIPEAPLGNVTNDLHVVLLYLMGTRQASTWPSSCIDTDDHSLHLKLDNFLAFRSPRSPDFSLIDEDSFSIPHCWVFHINLTFNIRVPGGLDAPFILPSSTIILSPMALKVPSTCCVCVCIHIQLGHLYSTLGLHIQLPILHSIWRSLSISN